VDRLCSEVDSMGKGVHHSVAKGNLVRPTAALATKADRMDRLPEASADLPMASLATPVHSTIFNQAPTFDGHGF
jgi:hypothetical protein